MAASSTFATPETKIGCDYDGVLFPTTYKSNLPFFLSKIVYWAHCQLGTSEVSTLKKTQEGDFALGFHHYVWYQQQNNKTKGHKMRSKSL